MLAPGRRWTVMGLMALGLGFFCGESEAQEARLSARGPVVVRYDRDGKKVEVVLRGPSAKAQVFLDGEKVPEETVTLEGDVLRFYTGEGDELGVVELKPDLSAYEGGDEPLKIGVDLREVDGALALQLALEPQESLLVLDVEKGLPAAQGGVERFDIITKINGEGPATRLKLERELSEMKAGEKLGLELLRKGTVLVLELEPKSGVCLPTVDLNLEPLFLTREVVDLTKSIVVERDAMVVAPLVISGRTIDFAGVVVDGSDVLVTKEGTAPSGDEETVESLVGELAGELEGLKAKVERLEGLLNKLRRKQSPR